MLWKYVNRMPYFDSRSGYYGWYVDHFETTPPIPTYLVGALVGNLKKSNEMEGSEVNVYTYNDYLNQVFYVTKETPTLFETMQNYTDSSNELTKMDFISIPDFDGDGMENWGINTYRYVNQLSSLVLCYNVICFWIVCTHVYIFIIGHTGKSICCSTTMQK